MARTIVTPDKQSISFDIPHDYVGKQIEVIAFAKDEGLGSRQTGKKRATFNAITLDTRGFKFNRDEANER